MGLDWLNATMGWIMYSSGIEKCYINNEKIFLLVKKTKTFITAGIYRNNKDVFSKL